MDRLGERRALRAAPPCGYVAVEQEAVRVDLDDGYGVVDPNDPDRPQERRPGRPGWTEDDIAHIILGDLGPRAVAVIPRPVGEDRSTDRGR